MSGNWATGSPPIAIRPPITVMIAMTIATMGRSIKNFEITAHLFIDSLCRLVRFCIRSRHHRYALANLLQTFNHYALTWFDAVFNDPLRADAFADFYRANVNFVTTVDNCDLISAL